MLRSFALFVAVGGLSLLAGCAGRRAVFGSGTMSYAPAPGTVVVQRTVRTWRGSAADLGPVVTPTSAKLLRREAPEGADGIVEVPVRRPIGGGATPATCVPRSRPPAACTSETAPCVPPCTAPCRPGACTPAGPRLFPPSECPQIDEGCCEGGRCAVP